MTTRVVVFRILFLVLIAHSTLLLSTMVSSSSLIATPSSNQTNQQPESSAAFSTSSTVNPAPMTNLNEDFPVQGFSKRLGEQQMSRNKPPEEALQINQAELCYLSNGGSSLTLTVNEATPVGSVIGTVEVNGDPSLETGNVDLFDSNAYDASQTAKQTNQMPQNNLSPIGDQLAAESAERPHQLIKSTSRRILGKRSAETTVTEAVFKARQQEEEGLAANNETLHLITSSQSSLESDSDRAGGSKENSLADEMHLPSSKSRRRPKMFSGAPPPLVKQLSSQSTTTTAAGNQQHELEQAPSSLTATGGLYTSGSFYSLVAGASNPQQTKQLVSSNQQTPALSAPVRLEPGTKNLILTRPLDRESGESEQTIVIQVHCSPRSFSNGANKNNNKVQQATSNSNNQQQQQQQPGSTTRIPVRILVTDSNDQAPEFVMPKFVVNISETAPVGSIVSRDILATDRDSTGPFSTLSYRVLDLDPSSSSQQATNSASSANNVENEDQAASRHSLLQFSNPLDPTLFLAAPLDYETMGSSFTLTIQATDQGEPEALSGLAQVLVNIIDFDDQNPRFLDDKYTLLMDESQQNLVGQNLQVLPRNLHAEDGDLGINAPILYSFDYANGQSNSNNLALNNNQPQLDNSLVHEETEPATNIDRYIHLNPSSGEIRLIRQWPSKWAGSPMTLVVRATQADNRDRYTLTTLTITKTLLSGMSLTTRLPVNPNKTPLASLDSSSTDPAPAGGVGVGQQQGIEFTPDRLIVNVSESAPVNEKIARVRARYLTGSGNSSDGVTAGDQAVDLIVSASGKSGSNSRNSRFAELASLANQQQQQNNINKRPIVYQILDDQLEQFGINGLGEIFLKKQLDYEQRQEFKFKVLASYTKYSDICHVQVNVMNVNDNKPKFSQPQYTFHLTESRLRSNIIGSVHAKDLDLKDSVRYSLTGEHSQLFDINPQSGQISLRQNIKQLNSTQCQLFVHATDSLGPIFHTHQARVNLHIAPQLIGRSLNLLTFNNNNNPSNSGSDLVQLDTFRPFPVSESRSLTTSTQQQQQQQQHQQSAANNAFSLLPDGGKQIARSSIEPMGKPASQRSSVATVMSSLQHMIKQANFFDMPLSSALLLSALLGLLVCLLVILLASMSVSIYRRRAKLRHRHHLTTLRHAHLAALQPNERARYLASSALSSVMSLSPPPPLPPNSTTTNNLHHGSQLNNQNSLSQQQLTNHNSSSSSSAGSSPQTTKQSSGNQYQAPTMNSQHKLLFAKQQLPLTSNLNELSSLKRARHQRTNSANGYLSQQLTVGHPKGARSQRPSSAQTNRTGSRLSQVSSSLLTTAGDGLASFISATLSSRGGREIRFEGPEVGVDQQTEKQQRQQSFASSLSSQSKRSYRSPNTTDDDSSVMHCGHYSINNTLANNAKSAKGSRGQLIIAENQAKSSGTSQAARSSVEAALKSLAREASAQPDPAQQQQQLLEMLSPNSLMMTDGYLNVEEQFLPNKDRPLRLINRNNNELVALTNSQPGIKAYRKIDSLVRPVNSARGRGNKVSPMPARDCSRMPEVGMRTRSQDSAIASDSSTNSAGNNGINTNVLDSSNFKMSLPRERAIDCDINGRRQLANNSKDRNAGLMNIIKSGGDGGHENYANRKGSTSPMMNPANIRWPSNVAPGRVKKLTWDDELSCASIDLNNNNNLSRPLSLSQQVNREYFLAPNLQLGFPMSPMQKSNHLYTNQQQNHSVDGGPAAGEQQQHFLFSNPCSPELVDERFPAAALSPNGYLAPGALHTTGTKYLQAQQQHLAQDSQLMSSMMGPNQDNCFDYTIVQSSQFQVMEQHQHQQPVKSNAASSSGKHHHQAQNYLYNDSSAAAAMTNARLNQANTTNNNNHQDLKNLMTTAVL